MTIVERIMQETSLSEGGGLLLFVSVSRAMEAEKVLRDAGYIVKLVTPPLELRKGCDLALEVNLVERTGIERLLEHKDVDYISITPLEVASSELLEIVKVTHFGDWVMVKVGNMKLTFDRESGIIVNVSGGGCPDIPYLHAELVGKPLTEAPRPRDTGFTLCALLLDRALEECLLLY